MPPANRPRAPGEARRWTYDFYDGGVRAACYRIQDGSDDGDVAECWDKDVAEAICKAMNERAALARAKETRR